MQVATIRVCLAVGLGWLLGCSAPAQAPKPAPAVGAAATAIPAAAAAAPDAAVVRVGTLFGIGYPWYVGTERGYFQEQGIDLQTELFRSGAEMVALLANRQLDAAQAATNPGLFNALARGIPVRAAFDISHYGEGQQSHAVLARQ